MYVAVHAVRSGWFSMLGQNHVSCDSKLKTSHLDANMQSFCAAWEALISR